MVYTPEFWKNYITSRSDSKDYTYHNYDHFSVSLSRKHSEPIYNWVGYFHDAEPSLILQKVLDFFKNNEKSFTLTTNTSDTVVLGDDLLKDYGFVHIGSYERMVIATEQLRDQTTLCDYEIREIGDKELVSDDNIEIIFTCFPKYFPTKEDALEYMKNRVEAASSRKGSEVIEFGAFASDTGKMIANASMQIKEDLPGLAEMAGSAVLPDHRKNGIYSAFLHERAKYALGRNIDHIFINADQNTSAPIVRKFGFQLVETLSDYHFTLNNT